MKRCPGYIWCPSGGTLSSAWGTTRPIVLLMRVSFVFRSALLNASGARRLHHLAPTQQLALHELVQLIRRAGQRPQAKLVETRAGLRRVHDVDQRLVQPRDD